MSVLDQYHREAKILQPVELHIRKINEIKEKHKAGELLTSEQYEKALKPVTSEFTKTQDLIRELVNREPTTLATFQSAKLPESVHETTNVQFPVDPLLNSKFAATILSENHLPPPSELISRTNHEMDKINQKHLANILKDLGRKKGRAKSKIDKQEVQKKIEVIQKYRDLLKASEGTGLFYYENSRQLIDKLEILVGQMRAGNDSVDIQNEAIAIIDKLLEQKKISKEDHEKLYNKLHRF